MRAKSDTFWAKQLFSSKNYENRTESMLAFAPETPCAIDLLLGAVEHLMMTLAVPISTPGDDMFANEVMLNDAALVGKTRQLLHELLLELQRLQEEPEVRDTPYASDFLRSRISCDHRLWDEYHGQKFSAAQLCQMTCHPTHATGASHPSASFHVKPLQLWLPGQRFGATTFIGSTKVGSMVVNEVTK